MHPHTHPHTEPVSTVYGFAVIRSSVVFFINAADEDLLQFPNRDYQKVTVLSLDTLTNDNERETRYITSWGFIQAPSGSNSLQAKIVPGWTLARLG